jgi:hypothetical protein
LQIPNQGLHYWDDLEEVKLATKLVGTLSLCL